jgi:hypothetical protein
MRESLTTLRTLDLPGGSLLPFTSTPGERVRVLYGRVWVTAEGDSRDAFLAAGEEVSLASRGLAVIEALGPARIELIENARAPSRIAHSAAALVRRVRAALRRLAPRSPRPLRGAA